MGNDAVAFQISSRTAEEFGEAVNPHAFRHIAATTIATADPCNVTDIAAVLAHTTLRPSEKHYNLARAGEAARSYHDTVKALRRPRPPPT
jgi:integrase